MLTQRAPSPATLKRRKSPGHPPLGNGLIRAYAVLSGPRGTLFPLWGEELFIAADAGGSNGYRSHAWKHELQKFADETRLKVHVSHFPPGTSKWNKIEHRLFCHITKNWRGKTLRSFETIVDSIGNIRTAAGLRVKAKLDKGTMYAFGHAVSHFTSSRNTKVTMAVSTEMSHTSMAGSGRRQRATSTSPVIDCLEDPPRYAAQCQSQ